MGKALDHCFEDVLERQGREVRSLWPLHVCIRSPCCFEKQDTSTDLLVATCACFTFSEVAIQKKHSSYHKEIASLNPDNGRPSVLGNLRQQIWP